MAVLNRILVHVEIGGSRSASGERKAPKIGIGMLSLDSMTKVTKRCMQDLRLSGEHGESFVGLRVDHQCLGDVALAAVPLLRIDIGVELDNQMIVIRPVQVAQFFVADIRGHQHGPVEPRTTMARLP